MGRIIAVAALVAVALCGPAAAQRFPEPPFYDLLPADYAYPLIRVCSTEEGICAIPFTVQPGTPCSCRRPDGAWVAGVCVR
jgi:hypothetical protein